MNEPENNPSAHDSAARRITSVDLAAALDQFSDVGLLTEGKINLIALDALIERLGERWATRRAQIHDYVDRFIQRRLGADGYHLRISETDVLICQPELGRFAGQAACLQILREVLTYFIGDATQADNCVHQVTKVSTTEIQGSRVRAGEVEQGERLEREASASARPRRTLDRWTPFVASDGRELRVVCHLEPVVELKSFGQIGLRIARRVLVTGSDEALTAEMVRKLSRADNRIQGCGATIAPDSELPSDRDFKRVCCICPGGERRWSPLACNVGLVRRSQRQGPTRCLHRRHRRQLPLARASRFTAQASGSTRPGTGWVEQQLFGFRSLITTRLP